MAEPSSHGFKVIDIVEMRGPATRARMVAGRAILRLTLCSFQSRAISAHAPGLTPLSWATTSGVPPTSELRPGRTCPAVRAVVELVGDELSGSTGVGDSAPSATGRRLRARRRRAGRLGERRLVGEINWREAAPQTTVVVSAWGWARYNIRQQVT